MKSYIIFQHIYDYDGERKLIGGIETYLQALAQVLIDNDIQPIVIQQGNKQFEKEDNGLLVRAYPVTSKKCSEELYKFIENEIKDEDLLIWGLDRDSIRTKHSRTISIQHGIPFDYYPIENQRRKAYIKWHLGEAFKWYQRLMAKKTFENAKYKVCVDYNFWNWYRTFCLPGEEENIFVIPNYAVVLPNYNRTFNVQEPLRVVFARRFVRMRGIEVYMDVVNHFKNDSQVEFTFAGEGPYMPQIEVLAKQQKNVKITKYNSGEAVKFHLKYDVAIVPSIASEGTSLSLLEAMSAGNAVIATCVGGMTNIVLDGYNGLFVRPNNSEDIISSIHALIENRELLRMLSVNAHETVAKAFSYENWKDKWSRVISIVINRG